MIYSIVYQNLRQTVNHSVEFKADDGTCINTIEGAWHTVKASLPTVN
jgi:hypothetical protein